MLKNIFGLGFLIIAVALFFSLFLPGLFHSLGGMVIGILTVLGVLLLVGFIHAVIFMGIGLLIGGIIGLIGVILLAVAFPFLAPLFIVIVPFVLLIKLVL